MEICTGNRTESHDEIIYERGLCPLCSALLDLKNAQAEIEKLNNQE